MTDISLTLAGEQVCLMSERALYWPGASTLVVGRIAMAMKSEHARDRINTPLRSSRGADPPRQTDYRKPGRS